MSLGNRKFLPRNLVLFDLGYWYWWINLANTDALLLSQYCISNSDMKIITGTLNSTSLNWLAALYCITTPQVFRQELMPRGQIILRKTYLAMRTWGTYLSCALNHRHIFGLLQSHWKTLTRFWGDSSINRSWSDLANWHYWLNTYMYVSQHKKFKQFHSFVVFTSDWTEGLNSVWWFLTCITSWTFWEKASVHKLQL